MWRRFLSRLPYPPKPNRERRILSQSPRDAWELEELRKRRAEKDKPHV